MALTLRLILATIHLLAVVFLVLVCIGSINKHSVIRSTWFIKLDLSNIIPASVPNAVLINSIAQSIGLHDFYQVGLWNFCEGYDDSRDITYCSPAKALYWFDPVKILLNELVSGASISLPNDINSALGLIRVISHWMFGLFVTGAVLNFVCIFIAPLTISSKPRSQHRKRRLFLRSLPITLISFMAALTTTVATVVATAMFIVFKNIITGQSDIDIKATVGKTMMAFMWTATGFALVGFVWQCCTCCAICCCGGRSRKSRQRQSEESNDSKSEKPLRSSATSNGAKSRFRWRTNRVRT